MTRRALTVLLASSMGCGPSVDVTVQRWLLCDECTEREMLAVKSHGNRAVGPLVAALRDGPSATQIANIRAQARSDRDAAERFRARHARALAPYADPIDTTSFLARAETSYVDQYRGRGLIGLSAIASDVARDSIHQLFLRDQEQSLGWSPAVRRQVRMHDLGVFDLRLLPFTVMQPSTTQQARWRIMGNNQNAALSWGSSQPGVVTVSPTGMLTAFSPGLTIITVCWDGVSPALCSSRVARVQ